MKVLVLALLCSFQNVPSLSVERAEDRTGDGAVWLELEAVREGYFAYEPPQVRVRFGIRREMLDEQLLQLFRRELDLPVQLQADWLDAVDSPRLDPLLGPTFACNDTIVQGAASWETRPDGETYRVVEFEAPVARLDGDVLEGALLRFATATRFEEDLVQGRLPVDRVEAYVRAEPLVLRRRVPPAEGRPEGYLDAIGQFELFASVSTSHPTVGQTLTFVLELKGRGNLEQLSFPPWRAPRGLAILGHLTETSQGVRRERYDLEVKAPGTIALPPVHFAYFDDERDTYARLSSPELRIEVQAAQPGSSPLPSSPDSPASTGTLRVLVLVAVGALLFVVPWILRARHVRRTVAPRRIQALRRFEADSGSDLLGAYGRFLEDLLADPRATQRARTLAQRLEAHGIPRDLADRAQANFGRLQEARYGVSGPSPEATTRALVEELARCSSYSESSR